MLKSYKIVLLILLCCLLFAGCQPEEVGLDPSESPLEQPVSGEPTVHQPPIITEPEPDLPGGFFVMVDNHANARPQSNLDKADIVYEFVCEGSITRFMAGYCTIDPGTVGPIRSARYYFAQMVSPYDTTYVHVGGNMDALAMIEDLQLKDMCDITNASGYFERDSSRKAPHNAYASTQSILDFSNKRHYDFVQFPENPLGKNEGGLAEIALQLIYGTDRYPNTVEWQYSEEEERYLRYVNGDIHATREGQQIYADNIIVLEMPVKTIEVPVDGIESEIKVIGTGKALFLRNGLLYEGQWKKSDAQSHFEYTLNNGQPYLYESGNVWVQQVKSIAENVILATQAVQ